MWEITVSAYRTPQTNKGSWSQHQQIPLNPDACQAQEGYVAQTLQNSQGQFIFAPKPPSSPSLHVECSMCFMRLHKKTMKANEKFHMRHRDGRIPHSKATTTRSPTASGFWWKNISLTRVLQLWLAVHLQRHRQHRISDYFRKNEVTFNFCPHFVLYTLIHHANDTEMCYWLVISYELLDKPFLNFESLPLKLARPLLYLKWTQKTFTNIEIK